MKWLTIVGFIFGLALSAATIFLGEKIGLESPLYKFGTAAITGLSVPFWMLIGWIRRKRQKPELDELEKPVEVSLPPEVKAGLAQKLELHEKVIQASKVAGDSLLHLLPRVFIIGPPGAGKSTALRKSGLEFPFTTAPEGGSDEMEIWVSRHGTLYDLPGRYFGDEGLDHAAWTELLKLVAKGRKPVAIDGILAVVGIQDLLNASKDDAELLAARMKKRIHECVDTFGWRMPIYVMFSNCDRLPGFVESFAVLPSAERAQPVGMTFGGDDDPEKVRADLDALIQHLKKEAMMRLPLLDSSLRSHSYTLPEQLNEAIGPLDLFLRRVVEPSATGDKARLAGVYFASSNQEGKAIDLLAPKMKERFDVDASTGTPPTSGAEGRSFFLHELFARVVLPGGLSLERSSLGRKRYAKRLALSVLAGFGSAALVASLSVTSYLNNKKLLESTLEIIRNSQSAKADPTADDRRMIAGLEPTAERLEELEAWTTDGPPLGYGFGFFSGEEMLPVVRRVFERAMKPLFVEAVSTELDSMLGDQTGSGDVAADYDVLRAYLMLTLEKERLDKPFVTRVLVEVWRRRLDASVSNQKELLEQLVRVYVEQVGKDAIRWTAPSVTLVSNARASLQRRNAEFERIIDAAKKEGGRPLGLSELIGGRVPDALRAGSDIERIYTLDGWRKVRKGLTGDGPDDVEAWVLAAYASDEQMVEKAKEQYLQRFAEAWRRFLRELSIREAQSLPDTRRVLEELTTRPSIIELLLKGMKTQMSFPTAEEDALAKAGGLLKGDKAKKADKAGALAGKVKDNPVLEEFQPLINLVAPPPDASGEVPPPPIGQLIDKLTAVKAAIVKMDQTEGSAETQEVDAAVEETQNAIETVFASVPEPQSMLLKPLLLDALLGVSSEAETERFSRTLRAFSAKVCEYFHETIAGRYPFDPDSPDDALLDSVTSFFGPTGAAWTFFEETLKNDLVRVGDSVQTTGRRPVDQAIIEFYRKALIVRASLFPGNAASLNREIQVKPQGVVAAPGEKATASGVTLEVGTEKRNYRFGPQEVWSFGWPSKQGRARLQLNGIGENPIEAWGDWALFRLMDKASITPLAGGWVDARFSFRDGKLQVPLHIRTSGTLNPFMEHSKFRLSCPRGLAVAAP